MRATAPLRGGCCLTLLLVSSSISTALARASHSPTAERARCAPGRFGTGCQFSARTIFQEHDVYANASQLPRSTRLDGWSPSCDFYSMLLRRYGVSFLVEVGVWKGKSAVCLAGELKRLGGGALIAVDTWLGALEFWTHERTKGKPDATRDLFLRNGYPQVYYHFLANMVHAGLQQYVVPFPVTSRLAHDFLAKLDGARPDLVHIDAAHEYADATDDIRLWWGLLQPGGVLLGDDFSRGWNGVVMAACEHAERYGLQMFRSFERGYVQKKWWVLKPQEDAQLTPHGAEWLKACTEQTPGGWRRGAGDLQDVIVVDPAGKAGKRRRAARRLSEVRANRELPLGVNFVPSYARNSVGVWQDYDAALVERELGYARRRFGFTSVRVMLNSLVHQLDPPRFLAHYEHLLASCAAHGLTALVVVFDRDFPDCDTPGCGSPNQTFVSSGAYRNSSWCPNPGPDAYSRPWRWPSLERYVDAVVGGRYAADERIEAVELMNEPREAEAGPFLAHFAARIAASTRRPIALEPQYAPPPQPARAVSSVYSYHTYGCGGGCMERTYVRLAVAAARENRTALNVELGKRPAQPYCDAIRGILRAGVGYYVWELMMGRDQFNVGEPPFQGLVWPNGSVYDEAEAACIKEANRQRASVER